MTSVRAMGIWLVALALCGCANHVPISAAWYLTPRVEEPKNEAKEKREATTAGELSTSQPSAQTPRGGAQLFLVLVNRGNKPVQATAIAVNPSLKVATWSEELERPWLVPGLLNVWELPLDDMGMRACSVPVLVRLELESLDEGSRPWWSSGKNVWTQEVPVQGALPSALPLGWERCPRLLK